MRLLGFLNDTRKKSFYVDGHEREDVVKYRADFTTTWMALFEQMTSYAGDTMNEIFPPHLEDGKPEVIWVTHDESIFYANDDGGKGWYDKAHPDLIRKEKVGPLWSRTFSALAMGGYILWRTEPRSTSLKPCTWARIMKDIGQAATSLNK